METLGVEAIISLVLAGLSLIVTFIGHYFYVRGKLHKAAAGAITNAEQDDKTGAEKLELAVDQVYVLVPASLKVFIHRSSVRKIVQAAFDKIEDYAKKQVEKKSKKKKRMEIRQMRMTKAKARRSRREFHRNRTSFLTAAESMKSKTKKITNNRILKRIGKRLTI